MGCIFNVSDTNLQSGSLKRIAELLDVLHLVCDVTTTVNKVNRAIDFLQELACMWFAIHKKFDSQSMEAFKFFR